MDMCTVNVSVDEKLLREYNPALSGNAAIRNWVQELIDSRLNEMKAVHDREFIEVDINNL
jgi:hypothetical protein